MSNPIGLRPYQAKMLDVLQQASRTHRNPLVVPLVYKDFGEVEKRIMAHAAQKGPSASTVFTLCQNVRKPWYRRWWAELCYRVGVFNAALCIFMDRLALAFARADG